MTDASVGPALGSSGVLAEAERELRKERPDVSATKNLEGLGETKRPQANIIILVIRPLEVVASLQALTTAYYDYFGAIADRHATGPSFACIGALGSPAPAIRTVTMG